MVEGSENTPTKCRYTDMVRFTEETAYYYNEMGGIIPKGIPLNMYNERVYKVPKWTEKMFNVVSLEDIPINSKGDTNVVAVAYWNSYIKLLI